MKIIGQSTPLKEVLRIAELVAGTDVPVLIMGATGTGKAVFAHHIYQQSRRHKHPFFKQNCASLSAETAESVLLGNCDNAADKIIGLVYQARSATLYLDEITALPLSLQAKLLNLIETGEFMPKGCALNKRSDVRIIASTNKDLHEEVAAGRFRADLYYRLNVIPLELPTLAERKDDIGLLIEYFFSLFVREKRLTSPSLSHAALRMLSHYNWPGNIRELKNVCERLFVLFHGREIGVNNLPAEIRHFSSRSQSPFYLPDGGIQLESVEIDLMRQALDKSQGNKSKAARLLGLTRDTFLYRLKKYALEA